MQRQPPVLHDDIIEDVDDSELPPSATPPPRSHAVQPRNLGIEGTDAGITPQPHHAEDNTRGISNGSTVPPLAPERTPATGRVATNGAARHALLARLATTPRSDPSRLKPQQRPQVHKTRAYFLQHATIAVVDPSPL